MSGLRRVPAAWTRVIKLGGSLLDYDRLVPELRRWLGAQEPRATVMVVGGGALADAIRDASARFPLSEEAAHWLCVRAMGVTAELAARLLPEARLVRRFADLLEPADPAGLRIFDVEDFLRHDDPRLSPEPLPQGWQVTSDSIAARLAVLLPARELVLLKSDLPPASATLAQLAAEGYVDAHFPRAAASVDVRCVNLRQPGFPELVRPAGSAGQKAEASIA